jgi:hypothetical protein
MLRATLTASLVLVAVSTLAHAESGTPQERAACHHDVVKLCKNVTPEEFPILDCLKAHRPKLSGACRNVLESHGQ